MAKIALLVIAATIALTSADGYGYGRSDDNPHYSFGYGVDDPHTHDHKSQHEERDGNGVTGRYTVKDADGTTRVIQYKSGPKSGFEAVVERLGNAKHPKSKYGNYGHDDGYGDDGASSYVGTTKWGNQGVDHEGKSGYGDRRQDAFGGLQKEEGYHKKQDLYGEHERKNIYGEHEKQDTYQGHEREDNYGGHKHGKDEGYGDDGKIDGYGEHEKEKVLVDHATQEGFEGRGY